MLQNTVRNRIKSLSRQVAEQIAAGEVVDRPVSIVKELVENAIDAGSTSIMIEIKNGGKSYLRVTDNGSGIEKEDVLLAFQRHATSKIVTAEDLALVDSLGFRGEALASIAAVSKVEMITRVATDRTGTRLVIEGGETKEHIEVGCPDGTTLIVSDLFYNTPARLKFMKPEATETGLIVELVSRLTLAYPEIKFRLIHNGTILFATNGKGDRYSVIQLIYAKETAMQLLHCNAENQSGMQIDGFCSAPSFTKPNRKYQIYFVNGRAVSSKLIDSAIQEAYREKTFDGRYPAVFLFLKFPPEKLDVNIHPNKREVRFDDEQVVKDFIREAIEGVLSDRESIRTIKPEAAFQAVSPVSPIQYQQGSFIESKSNAMEMVDRKYLSDTISQETARSFSKINDVNDSNEKVPTNKLDFTKINITGSIFNTYLIGQDENHLYLIDQHAAHERIYYERLLSQMLTKEHFQQNIMVPFVVNVTHATKINVSEWIEFLGPMGFALEEFGNKAYLVKSIPSFMDLEEARIFLDDFFDQAAELKGFQDQRAVDRVVSHACRMSVKARDHLKPEEIDRLLLDLSKTKQPYTCPHGRPTVIKMSHYELERYFKRV